MLDNTDLAPSVRWTDAEVQKRLRALWLNWYKVSRIAEIFGCKPGQVSAAAYRMNLPYRPLNEFRKWKRRPELERWPETGYPVSTYVVPKYLRLRPRPPCPRPAVIVLPYVPPLRVDVVSTRQFSDMLPLEAAKRVYPISTFVIPLYLRLEATPPRRPRPVIWLPHAEPGQPLVIRARVVATPPPPWSAPVSKPPPVAKPKTAVKPTPAKAKPVPPKRMPLPHKATAPRLKKGDRVFSEEEDQAQIEEFLRLKGATRIPIGVCVHDVAAGPRSFEDRKAEHQRIASSQRRWNEFRAQQAAMRRTI